MELVMCNLLHTVVRKSVSNRQRAQRSEYRFNNKGVRQMWIPQMQDARLWWPAIYIPFGRKRENVTARQSVHFALNWRRSMGIGVEGVVIMNCALFRRPLADGWDFGERIWSMIRMLYVSSLQFIKTNVQCLYLIHLIRCTTRPIHQHSTQFYVWDVKIQGQCNGQVDDETDENWWRICAKTDDGMELTVRYGLVCVGFAEHIFFGSLLSSDTNAGCKHWNGNVHGLGRWISDLIRFICTDDDRGETLMDFLSRSMNYAYLINGKVSMNNNPLLWHAHILLFLSCSNNGYWAIVATLRDCELWRSIERIDDANRKLLLCTERS